MSRSAFTLIELLVVITIIVVLLALLTPALDKAIYQAELASCGSGLKGIASGVMLYAVDQKRSYPDRPHARSNQPAKEIRFDPSDDRPRLRPYMSVNGLLICPLSPGGVDLDIDPNAPSISATYYLFSGVQYAGNRGMLRLGDRFEWNTSRYDVLASDGDEVISGSTPGSYTSHPDHEGRMIENKYQNERVLAFGPFTTTRWAFLDGTHKRPPVDTQHVLSDASVVRFEKVTWDEPYLSNARVDNIPIYTSGANSADWHVYVPRGGP